MDNNRLTKKIFYKYNGLKSADKYGGRQKGFKRKTDETGRVILSEEIKRQLGENMKL